MNLIKPNKNINISTQPDQTLSKEKQIPILFKLLGVSIVIGTSAILDSVGIRIILQAIIILPLLIIWGILFLNKDTHSLTQNNTKKNILYVVILLVSVCGEILLFSLLLMSLILDQYGAMHGVGFYITITLFIGMLFFSYTIKKLSMFKAKQSTKIGLDILLSIPIAIIILYMLGSYLQ